MILSTAITWGPVTPREEVPESPKTPASKTAQRSKSAFNNR
jgi:hypothetical protein